MKFSCPVLSNSSGVRRCSDPAPYFSQVLLFSWISTAEAVGTSASAITNYWDFQLLSTELSTLYYRNVQFWWGKGRVMFTFTGVMTKVLFIITGVKSSKYWKRFHNPKVGAGLACCPGKSPDNRPWLTSQLRLLFAPAVSKALLFRSVIMAEFRVLHHNVEQLQHALAELLDAPALRYG